jgi:hypothetical protein
MSGILGKETAAKAIKCIRESDQGTAASQTMFVNLVWTLYDSDLPVDKVDLAPGEAEEILSDLPTDMDAESEETA